MTPAQFHLDESADGRIATGLRKRDRDCTTSTDAELLSADDVTQLAYAFATDRVLITRDSDFAELHAEAVADEKHPRAGHSHAGIIFWCSKKHFGTIIKEIDMMASEMDADHFKDRLFFL